MSVEACFDAHPRKESQVGLFSSCIISEINSFRILTYSQNTFNKQTKFIRTFIIKSIFSLLNSGFKFPKERFTSFPLPP